MKWPLVTRRRYEEAVNRHHQWHMRANEQWTRLHRAIAEHKQAADLAYGPDEHDAWDRELWDAISARIDVRR